MCGVSLDALPAREVLQGLEGPGVGSIVEEVGQRAATGKAGVLWAN